MKLTFDSNLQYQQDAIKSITGLFEGQPLEDSIMEFNLKEEGALDLINGVSNNLILSEEQILKNLQSVQDQNEIEQSKDLDGMHFSVEMETGTGKTYVYLRSIYELNKAYGFKKVCHCCSVRGYSRRCFKKLGNYARAFPKLVR